MNLKICVILKKKKKKKKHFDFRPSSSVRYAKLSLSVGEENEDDVTRSLLDSGIDDVTRTLLDTSIPEVTIMRDS